MNHNSIDPEEMEKRRNEDYIASLKMVGEGSPRYDPIEGKEDVEEMQDGHDKLPETYQ